MPVLCRVSRALRLVSIFMLLIFGKEGGVENLSVICQGEKEERNDGCVPRRGVTRVERKWRFPGSFYSVGCADVIGDAVQTVLLR